MAAISTKIFTKLQSIHQNMTRIPRGWWCFYKSIPALTTAGGLTGKRLSVTTHSDVISKTEIISNHVCAHKYKHTADKQFYNH